MFWGPYLDKSQYCLQFRKPYLNFTFEKLKHGVELGFNLSAFICFHRNLWTYCLCGIDTREGFKKVDGVERVDWFICPLPNSNLDSLHYEILSSHILTSYFLVILRKNNSLCREVRLLQLENLYLRHIFIQLLPSKFNKLLNSLGLIFCVYKKARIMASA